MTDLLIDIENVSKKYTGADRYSLKSVNLKIYEGEKFGFFGPNGAGKTTLISILCQILPFNEGKVTYYLGSKPIEFHSIRQKIGFVPQDLALYEDLTARQNISYFGAMYNMKPNEVRKRSVKSNYPVLFLILQICGLGIVNYALIQNELNKLVA